MHSNPRGKLHLLINHPESRKKLSREGRRRAGKKPTTKLAKVHHQTLGTRREPSQSKFEIAARRAFLFDERRARPVRWVQSPFSIVQRAVRSCCCCCPYFLHARAFFLSHVCVCVCVHACIGIYSLRQKRGCRLHLCAISRVRKGEYDTLYAGFVGREEIFWPFGEECRNDL